MKLVAIGGGHGTAVVVEAATQLDAEVTAIVSVADDGGSSGKLRTAFDIPAVGDVRRCIGSACLPTVRDYLERRVGFDSHPIGNLLLIAALREAGGDLTRASDVVAELVGASPRVRVVPVTNTPVDVCGETPTGPIFGQTNVHNSPSVIRLSVVPSTVTATTEAIEAILKADIVVLGPGSHFTSVLAALVVPGIREALDTTSAQSLWVANLLNIENESRFLGPTNALQSVREHGVFPDVALVDDTLGACDLEDISVVRGSFASPNLRTHLVNRLAPVLQSLVAD